MDYDLRTDGVDLENAMTDAPTTDGWRRSFQDPSQSQFSEQFADEIVLEATTLAKSVEGKHSVAAVLAAASSIYESLEFTAEAQSARRRRTCNGVQRLSEACGSRVSRFSSVT
jgi:hypothetical protein